MYAPGTRLFAFLHKFNLSIAKSPQIFYIRYRENLGGFSMNKLFNTHPLVVDKEIATILGLNEALVLQQLNYWIEKNRENNRNFHEGRYWTYNTINEWQEEFPSWSTSAVKRVFFMQYLKKWIYVNTLDIRVISKEEIILALNNINYLIEPNIAKDIN